MKKVTEGASLTSQVTSAIREAILSGELKPGVLYSIGKLADELQVSRTPIREALLGVAEIGLVQVERGRGFRVVQQDAQHLANVFDLRLLLESPLAGRAAAAADDALLTMLGDELDAMRAAARNADEPQFIVHDRRFHDAILVAGGNDLLLSTVSNLRDSIATIGVSTVARLRTLDDIADEHVPILAAIVARDPKAAEAAMRAHVAHTGELMVQVANDSYPQPQS